MQKRITEKQIEKLSALLKYAWGASSAYRRKMEDAGFDPESFQAPENLGRIPFLDREDLVSGWRDFACMPQEEWIDVCSTGGTTGKILYLPFSRRDKEIEIRNIASLLSHIGVSSRDTVQLMLPLENTRPAATGLQAVLLYEIGALVIRAGPASLDLQIKYIRDFRPNVLIGTPDFLLLLGRELQRRGFNPGCDFKVRLAICPGQPLNGPGWQVRPIRRQIEEIWGMEVFSLYGSTEINGGLVECTSHAGHHFLPESLIFEVIHQENGVALPPGEKGELVVTTLDREALPLIRYRTGDLTWMESEECACGLSGDRVMAILGHSSDKFKVKGTILYAAQIEEILSTTPGITAHLVEVNKDERGIDQLTLHVSAQEESEKLAACVRKNIKDFTGVTPVIAFMSEEEIYSRWFAGGRGKPKKFWDRRVNRDVEMPA